MTEWTDQRLEAALTRLALELEGPDQVTAIRSRLDEPAPTAGRRLALVAATVLVAATAVVAIPGTREVAADWLGIGATSVETVDELPRSTPGDPQERDSGPPTADPRQALADAGYPELLPATLDAQATVAVDDLQAQVRWSDLELTIRPLDGDTVMNRKLVTVDQVVKRLLLADGSPAVWVPPGHVILRGTTAEVADGVLLWVAAGHEYRLEGADNLVAAVETADSME